MSSRLNLCQVNLRWMSINLLQVVLEQASERCSLFLNQLCELLLLVLNQTKELLSVVVNQTSGQVQETSLTGQSCFKTKWELSTTVPKHWKIGSKVLKMQFSFVAKLKMKSKMFFFVFFYTFWRKTKRVGTMMYVTRKSWLLGSLLRRSSKLISGRATGNTPNKPRIFLLEEKDSSL